jgi:hypothetical protein
VNERTQDLLRLTEIDYLTGLLNRRGMTDKLEGGCTTGTPGRVNGAAVAGSGSFQTGQR